MAKIGAGALSTQTIAGVLITTGLGTAGRLYLAGHNGAGVLVVQSATNATTFSANPGSASNTRFVQSGGISPDWIYLQISFILSSLSLNITASPTGVPGSFVSVLFVPIATFLGTPITGIGLGTQNQVGNTVLTADWFRRVA
jgi:hypothetical protein